MSHRPVRNAGIADGSIRAYENSVAFLADNADWADFNVMTANLNLWPSVSVLIVNPRLSARRCRRTSGKPWSMRPPRRLRVPSRRSATRTRARCGCRAGARFAVAKPRDLVAIEKALQPVVDALRRDPSWPATSTPWTR